MLDIKSCFRVDNSDEESALMASTSNHNYCKFNGDRLDTKPSLDGYVFPYWVIFDNDNIKVHQSIKILI